MSSEILCIDSNSYQRAVSLRDLTNGQHGDHAMQLVITGIVDRLQAAWQCHVLEHREHPVKTVRENYDELQYPSQAVARETRYTRYVAEDLLLRTHTSAAIPGLLRTLSAYPPPDMLLVCPGLVYRRDVIDRLHTGEPHQLDLWRIVRGGMSLGDLNDMIHLVVESALPGWKLRTIETEHPYTLQGRQIDVSLGDDWVEIGECGLAHPRVLEQAGVDPSEYGGLAMGLGLDRLVMLRKSMNDIRLLRASDPRIADQMLDLEPYRPVSNQPAVQQDLSVAVAHDLTEEELGDRVRAALSAADADNIESVIVVSETGYDELVPQARTRLGMQDEQKNVLLRVTLRALDRSLTHVEANRLRDNIYKAVHEGAAPGYVHD